MLFFDYICGCRMHLSFIVLLGVLDDFTFCLIDYLFFVLDTSCFILDLFDFFMLINRLTYLRLRGIAILDLYDLLFNSLSGVLARSCGIL